MKGEYQPEFSDDGRYIASATGQGHVKVWDTHTKEDLVVFTNETFAVAFTERGRTLVTLGIDYSLKFWDWEKRHLRTRRVLSPIPKEERLGVVRLDQG